jgi:hypothetical protein
VIGLLVLALVSFAKRRAMRLDEMDEFPDPV